MWRQQQQGDHLDSETLQVAQALVQLVGGLTSSGHGSLLSAAGRDSLGVSNGRDYRSDVGYDRYRGSGGGGDSGPWEETSSPAGGRSMQLLSGSGGGGSLWSNQPRSYEPAGGDYGEYPMRSSRPRSSGGTQGGQKGRGGGGGGGYPVGGGPVAGGAMPVVSQFGGKLDSLSAEARREALAMLWSGGRPSDFDMVPQKYLYCRDCNVRTDNSSYFLNHLRGNKHIKTMETALTECVEKLKLMKEEIKKVEEKSTGGSAGKKERCQMCSTNVAGSLGQHRGKAYHQRLKCFTHPTCEPCGEKFQTRLDWEAHRFLPQHLLMVAELGLPADAKLQADLEFDDELRTLQKRSGGQANRVANKNGSAANKPAAAGKTAPVASKKADTAKKAAMTVKAKATPVKMAAKTTAVETITIEPEVAGNLEMFDPEKAVGREHVVTVTRYMCKLCKQFLPTEPEMQQHLRTRAHWDKCVEAAGKSAAAPVPTKKKSAVEAAAVSTTVDDEDEDDEDVVMLDEDEDEEEAGAGGKRKKVAAAAEAKKKK